MTMRSEPTIRNLLLSDLPAAMQLSTEAGWNQTEADWQILIELAPQSCFAIEVAGELASTATLLCYGRRLAWIGMVLTRASFQGRGFARRLLNSVLNHADELKIESVKLDATEQGRPLYESLGFRPEQAVERWSRSAEPATPRREIPTSSSWRASLHTDRLVFGADRSDLLLKLAEHAPPLTNDRAYLLTRPGRTTRYLGPCVADQPASARALIESALASSSETSWSWDLLPKNTEAVALARDLNFVPKRRLLRMVRGKELRGQESNIYAIAGFELG